MFTATATLRMTTSIRILWMKSARWGCRSSYADGWRYTGKARESPGLRAEYWDTEESTKFLKFCFLLFGFTRKHDNEYQEVLLMILFGFLT